MPLNVNSEFPSSAKNKKPEIINIENKKDSSTTLEKKSLKIPSAITPSAVATSLIQYSTGRRKNSIARVWVKAGKGVITVNKKPLIKYFPLLSHHVAVQKPFEATNTMGQYDITCTVKGGGCSGQAGAILHGVARALDKLVPEFHKALRDHGLLTRDSRIVERKKYGKSGARKSYQFSKR